MTYILIAIALAIMIIAMVFFGRNLWKPKLSSSAQSKVNDRWNKAVSQLDAHRRLLEADSVLDLCFTELGYKGSLGDKLKKAGKFLRNENEVWKAHKLRNRIAHEPGVQLQSFEVEQAVAALRKGIDTFLRN